VVKDWPAPTSERPERRDIDKMAVGTLPAKATDGCSVRYDGTCRHEYPSWPLYLGLVR
jgi:hypothetical protein